MKISLFGPGDRVRIQKGRYPLDPSLPGRSGTVVRVDHHRLGRYDVALDDDQEVRSFAEEELGSAEVGSADVQATSEPDPSG